MEDNWIDDLAKDKKIEKLWEDLNGVVKMTQTQAQAACGNGLIHLKSVCFVVDLHDEVGIIELY